MKRDSFSGGPLSKTKGLSKLRESQLPGYFKPDPDALGGMRFWRLGLIIKHLKLQLVVEVNKTMTVGRSDDEHTPDIDLKPFSAVDLGVSRRHLFIKLDSDSAVISDNNSLNGTLLNGARLEPGKFYAIRKGDEIVLGSLALQVEILVNPLE